ncbi:MAG: hypothetical protein FJ083_00890 [Cyanobacteria bacterium K_Offshore_surface_m2_239]|nr:hypothetical protein [Cyanobacteria bacterium K_Offshore_surface_m2_239]
MAAGLALSGVLFLVAGASCAFAAEPPPTAGDRSLLTRELQLDPAERSRFQRVAEDGDNLAAAPANGAASTPAVSPWAGTLELYGFLPLKVINRTTIQGFTAETNLSLGQLLDALTSTFSVRGSVEHGRLGLLTDLSDVNLRNQVASERSRDRFRIGDGRLRAGLDAYRTLTSEEGRDARRARLRGRAAERLATLGKVELQRGELAASAVNSPHGWLPVNGDPAPSPRASARSWTRSRASTTWPCGTASAPVRALSPIRAR